MRSKDATSRTPGQDSLWLLTIAPVMWAAHLMLCYVTAAIWCAKFTAPGGSLGNVRSAIAGYTALALIGIASTGWEGFRRQRYGAETGALHRDSPEDRHRFLGFATLLLSGLSAVAVLYAALAAVFFDTCR